MKRILLAALGAISLSACAQAPDGAAQAQGSAKPAVAALATAKPKAGTADARAVEAVRLLNPQVQVDRVGAAPLPGFREAIVAGQVVYVSDDGKYLMCYTHGALYEFATGLCVDGPCKGQALYRLPVRVDRGEILVGCPEGDLSYLKE